MQIMERWRGRAARAELRRLQGGRPNFHVYFSASQVAAHLGDYGEDDLALRAITMSAHELAKVQAIASWYEDPPTIRCP